MSDSADLKLIIAYFEPDTEEQVALERAIELARKSKAKVLLAGFAHTDFSFVDDELAGSIEENIQKQAMEALKQQMANCLESLGSNDCTIESQCYWDPRPHKVIQSICESQSVDLLIKASSHHSHFEGVFRTPLDWHLLREVPCPVLMVTQSKWLEGQKVLCALDVYSNDEEHNKLNRQIIERGEQFASLYNADSQWVSVCPPLPVLMNIEYTDIDPLAYQENQHKRTRLNAQPLLETYGASEEKLIITDGITESALAETAEEVNAGLMILGTVSNTGIKGYFIGNTAEQVLHHTQCDVLALKPV